MTDPILTLTGITKTFPGVRALHNVSLELFAGEVTALIGENGAGKSTLVKTMTGIYQADGGEIRVNGKVVSLPTAISATAAGITAIHQETVLFDELSVAENIYLGHAPRNRLGLIDWKTMKFEAQKTLDAMGAGIDAGIPLKELGIAKKHLVAVARALSVDAQVVIMDEPTAALSQKEIEELYVLVELLKKDGKAILFISHKFDEIYRICDRFTVFRDGEMVGKGFIQDTPENEIVKLMVGRPVDHIFPARNATIGETVLEVKGLSHPTEFEDISFAVKKGEILGFYGLVGAGRSEVMQAIFGMTTVSSGSIVLDGQTIVPKSPADAVEAGIVYVPEERGKQGVITGEPIFKNVSLPSLDKTSSKGFIRMAEEYKLARTYTERLDLRASSLSQNVSTLSGGNQQKVVIAKWLATLPKVIILDEPTKGIDIGSKAAVHEFMGELVSQGLSVIMVSSELPEILGMSDRVVVMREGLMIDTLENTHLQPETLVRLAAGIAEGKAA